MFRSRHKKNRIFCPKMVKKCHFVAQNSVFGAGVVTCRAPYPIFRVLDSQRSFCKVLEQTIKGFRAAITKKTHYLAKNCNESHFLA